MKLMRNMRRVLILLAQKGNSEEMWWMNSLVRKMIAMSIVHGGPVPNFQSSFNSSVGEMTNEEMGKML